MLIICLDSQCPENVYEGYYMAISPKGLSLSAYMAIQCQYDLEAHLDDIITLLLHPRKFVSIVSFAFLPSSASETKKLAR